jgi:hypothetical protein
MSANTKRSTTVADTERGHSPLERVTVNLTPRSSKALREAVELTGDTKTDAINRALQIYAFLEGVWSSGGSVYVRQSPDSEPELLRAF